MQPPRDTVRQSDVTGWAFAAIACCGLAVLSANITALVPETALLRLHMARIGGTNLETLRSQTFAVHAETLRLARETEALSARLGVDREARLEMARRMGAVEETLPHLAELLASGQRIDVALLTASTADEDGGTENANVAVRYTPLFGPEGLDPITTAAIDPTQAAPSPASTPLPERPAFGVAIEGAFSPYLAEQAWADISERAGPLLLGLTPLLLESAGANEIRLVLGPLDQHAQAEALCARLARIDAACEPVPYSGSAWPESMP